MNKRRKRGKFEREFREVFKADTPFNRALRVLESEEEGPVKKRRAWLEVLKKSSLRDIYQKEGTKVDYDRFGYFLMLKRNAEREFLKRMEGLGFKKEEARGIVREISNISLLRSEGKTSELGKLLKSIGVRSSVRDNFFRNIDEIRRWKEKADRVLYTKVKEIGVKKWSEVKKVVEEIERAEKYYNSLIELRDMEIDARATNYWRSDPSNIRKQKIELLKKLRKSFGVRFK